MLVVSLNLLIVLPHSHPAATNRFQSAPAPTAGRLESAAGKGERGS